VVFVESVVDVVVLLVSPQHAVIFGLIINQLAFGPWVSTLFSFFVPLSLTLTLTPTLMPLPLAPLSMNCRRGYVEWAWPQLTATTSVKMLPNAETPA